MTRPRAATSAQASASDRTPAICAAVSSPMECPISRSGTSPQDSTSRKSAVSTANNAGCVYAVWSSSADSAVPGAANTTSLRGRSSSGSNSTHTASNAAANTGNASRNSCAIPARCAPWPVNRKVGEGRSRTSARTTPLPGAPVATAFSPASSSSWSAATTTARCGIRARVAAVDQARSASRASGRSVTCAASRAA